MIVAPPRTGTRGSLEANAAANAAKGAPYRRQHDASTERASRRDRMPQSLEALLAWFAEGWTGELPEKLHTVEVWNGRQEYRTVERDGKRRVEAVWTDELVGGSALGSHADTSLFRRYMEGYAGQRDVDGYYVRPMHAAVARVALRDHWMARNLFAVAQAGFDWKGVADRGRWVHGMYRVYLTECLRRLWLEFSDVGVRLV